MGLGDWFKDTFRKKPPQEKTPPASPPAKPASPAPAPQKQIPQQQTPAQPQPVKPAKTENTGPSEVKTVTVKISPKEAAAKEAAKHTSPADQAALYDLEKRFRNPHHNAAARVTVEDYFARELAAEQTRIIKSLEGVFCGLIMMEGLDAALQYKTDAQIANPFTKDESEDYATVLVGLLVTMNAYERDDQRKNYRAQLFQFLSNPQWGLLAEEDVSALRSILVDSNDRYQFNMEGLKETHAGFATKLENMPGVTRQRLEQLLASFIEGHKAALIDLATRTNNHMPKVIDLVPEQGLHEANQDLRLKVKNIIAPCRDSLGDAIIMAQSNTK